MEYVVKSVLLFQFLLDEILQRIIEEVDRGNRFAHILKSNSLNKYDISYLVIIFVQVLISFLIFEFYS